MGKAVIMFQMYLRVHYYLATASADIENRALIFITFFNIYSFTGHIQRFWTQILNSAVFAEIFISQKWVFFDSWCSVCISMQMCNRASNPWDMDIFSRPGTPTKACSSFNFREIKNLKISLHLGCSLLPLRNLPI